MRAIQDYRDKLPNLTCTNCGKDEFTVKRQKIKVYGHEGDLVVNRLECHFCGEAVAILP